MSKQINIFIESQMEEEPKIRKEYLEKLEKIRKGKFNHFTSFEEFEKAVS